MKQLIDFDASRCLAVKRMKEYIEIAEHDKGHLDGYKVRQFIGLLSLIGEEICSLLQNKESEQEKAGEGKERLLSTANKEEGKRPETKGGRSCFVVDCIFHPLHENWKRDGESVMDTIRAHSEESGHIWCKREMHIGGPRGATCSDFKEEK